MTTIPPESRPNNKVSPLKVAFIGTYPPRQCGIATFTHDLMRAVGGQPNVECVVVPMVAERGSSRADECLWEIDQHDRASYRRAARVLDQSCDVICVQHEYGIYGGPSGAYLLDLLEATDRPVVATLHTVLRKPSAEQRFAMEGLLSRASHAVVMAERGVRYLEAAHPSARAQLELIPHGVPDFDLKEPAFHKARLGLNAHSIVLTFGLLGPGKGIELMVQALPTIVQRVPNALYLVVGATHPNLIKEQGEAYRESLERLAESLGVSEHLQFVNRYVPLEELKDLLGSADAYVTPYVNEAQITSGTLAYSFGCGRAVVSTPYWHAEELLADGRGVLVPFGDAAAMGGSIADLLLDDERRLAMQSLARRLGRGMIWPRIGERYTSVLRESRLPKAAAQATTKLATPA